MTEVRQPSAVDKVLGVQHHVSEFAGTSFRCAGRAPHPQYLDTEWQANAWALAFLMPAKEQRQLEVGP